MVNLDELMRLREEATPGPWETMCHTTCYGDSVEAVGNVDGDMIVHTAESFLDEHANAAYICAACNAVPELVNTIRDMKKAIANMGIMIAAAYKNQISEGGNDAGRKNA